MSDTTSSAGAVVADTIVRTVELGVRITDAAVDGEVTVVFCNLLDDGVGRRCPVCGGEGVYRDTVIRKVTDVPVVGHPLWLRVLCRATAAARLIVRGKCSPTTPPSSHARALRPRGGAPATSCAD